MMEFGRDHANSFNSNPEPFLKAQKLLLNSYLQLPPKLKKIKPSTIGDIVNSLENTILKKSKVYVIGNGGSCATASYFVHSG